MNVFPIEIPSLRERADDIPLLVEYLIERYAKKAGKRIRKIQKKTLDLFQVYDWPGNIRELQNLVERAVIIAGEGVISSRHLPPEAPTAANNSTSVRADAEDSIVVRVGPQMHELEEAYINLVLKHTKNNRTRAAEILGISLRTLQNRLKDVQAKTAAAQ